jgi:hypothetical protein
MYPSSPYSYYVPWLSISVDLIILIIVLCEAYKLWSSSLCSIVETPIASSFFGAIRTFLVTVQLEFPAANTVSVQLHAWTAECISEMCEKSDQEVCVNLCLLRASDMFRINHEETLLQPR